MDNYLTPTNTHRSELEIKRSRFITTINHVADKQQAAQVIHTLRLEMPEANHHCWAMIAGQPQDIYQQDQSDDGEPKGTAGKPMLNVLSHSGMGNIVVVVSRYFGGIKLGSGGLVRAYTRSVTEALKLLDTQLTYITTQMSVSLPYSAFDSFEYWLSSTNIVVSDKQFQDSIMLTLAVPESSMESLKAAAIKAGGTVQKINGA